MTHDLARPAPPPTSGDFGMSAPVPVPAPIGPRPSAAMGPGGWIPLLGAAIPIAVFLLGWLEHRLAPPPASVAAPAPSLGQTVSPGAMPRRADAERSLQRPLSPAPVAAPAAAAGR